MNSLLPLSTETQTAILGPHWIRQKQSKSIQNANLRMSIMIFHSSPLVFGGVGWRRFKSGYTSPDARSDPDTLNSIY